MGATLSNYVLFPSQVIQVKTHTMLKMILLSNFVKTWIFFRFFKKQNSIQLWWDYDQATRRYEMSQASGSLLPLCFVRKWMRWYVKFIMLFLLLCMLLAEIKSMIMDQRFSALLSLPLEKQWYYVGRFWWHHCLF